MRNILRKLFQKPIVKTANRPGKTRAQSLVEFAIALPVILLLFSGVIEFGFALNYYLSLLDATRESARFYSNLDPFNTDLTDNMDFYANAAAMVRANLDPQVVNPSYQGRRIVLDPNADDVIVTVYSSSGGNVVRYPASGPYHLYNNHSPIFTNEDIEARLVSGSPNAGILLVEVHYNYHQVLGLPWIQVFVPDPMRLRTYTIFPLSAAEPAN
jgi:hypothetical protein